MSFLQRFRERHAAARYRRVADAQVPPEYRRLAAREAAEGHRRVIHLKRLA